MAAAQTPLAIPKKGPPEKGYFYKYGVNWDKRYAQPQNALYLELTAFRLLLGVERIEPFKNVCRILWPNTPDSPKKFFFNDWTDQMLEAACQWNYLSVMGSGSSGKTVFFAIWAIVNYLCAPKDTKVIVTSTTLNDARARIWGAITQYWLARPGLPGKLVNSLGTIRYQNGKDFDDMCGITLIAGAPTKAQESVAKMIGFKNKRMILIGDELPELSEAIVEAALTNLTLNPYFQLIGLGNPKNHFDPMARMTIPKDGNWDSVNVNTGSWETKLGFNIHLDGRRSPNVMAGKALYPGIITAEKIAEAEQRLGANSSGYWRMIVGFYNPAGEDNAIYHDAELEQSGAMQTLGNGFAWLDNDLTPVAALDPSYTTGGDSTMMVWGKVGKNIDGRKTLLIEGHCPLFEDVENKELTRTQQIIMQFKDKCVKLGIQPRHMAFDATGAGKPFGDVVDVLISKEVLHVDFGGRPSEKPVSAYDSTPAVDRYVNRVSELWYSGLEYFRTNQIKGITREIANELCQRKKSEEKASGLFTKIRVESKREMKSRNLPSPDLADSFFVLLELCRERLGMDSGVVQRAKDPQKSQSGNWKKAFRKYSDVYVTA